MRIITKQNAIDTLKSKKIIFQNPEQSESVQKVLLSLGFRWASGKQEVRNTTKDFLALHAWRDMTYFEHYGTFTDSKYDIITAQEILDWDIIEKDENSFKYKQEVLVKNSSANKWVPAIFAYKIETEGCLCPYVVWGGNSYKYCIPLLGNEKLIGKE